MLSKIFEILKKPRLPWIVISNVRKLINRFYYYFNYFYNMKLFDINSNRKNVNKKAICFKCGFHVTASQNTGAIYAISNIANALSSYYLVEFYSFPCSSYNRLLNRDVKIVRYFDLNADLYICDAECDHDFYKNIRMQNIPLIITCHSFLDSAHGLTPQYLKKSLSYANNVHFVSESQKISFGLKNKECFIIPNFTSPVNKTLKTNNIGAVGNFNNEDKNADETVQIGLQSSADEVHLWYADYDKWNNNRVKLHKWENDKNKIFNSFDVFVFLSKNETFGMVVIEALSAGMPCVLSSIPVFQALFSDCPGVVLIDSKNRKYASLIVDDLLSQKDQLRETIIDYWRENYSKEFVVRRWLTQLKKVFY